MSETTGNTDEREAVARALCEKHIRNVRRHDTDATTLEAVLPGAIEMHWFDFQLDADAALSALAPIRAAEILAAERERDALREALERAAFRLDTAAPYQDTAQQTAVVHKWANDARAALTANHSAPQDNNDAG